MNPSMNIGDGGLVRRNSIRHQFAALERDKDAFQKEMDKAERERRSIEGVLRELKVKQRTLTQQKHAAKETLGGVSKKSAFLNHEKRRLGRIMNNETKALKDCAKHYQMLKDEIAKDQENFVTDADKLSDEYAKCLELKTAILARPYLSVKSVQDVAAKNGSLWSAVPSSHSFNMLSDANGRLVREEQAHTAAKQRLDTLQSIANKHMPTMTEWGPANVEWNGEMGEESPPGPGAAVGRANLDAFYGSQPDDC
uniref:F-BAR domain-containing protein n=1 Tax=Craspedostauros australis TaxID=1486917 RepID=A0A7R9WSE9_9STRA|mmetsp:Transcript_1641/g.4499  ORF Transcript_1641/g.4499 Transcript_1641/m.4499 type:complete len:253 (+) Transcript_1641:123-881(+)